MSSYDVFLSHNSADKEVVREVAERLAGAGIKSFFDERDLVGGDDWQERLIEALEDSTMCAVFLGPDGLGPWNNQEVKIAIDLAARNPDYRVIPVLLPGASKSSAPWTLKLKTWVDLTDGVGPWTIEPLLAAIRGGDHDWPRLARSARPARSTKRTGLYGTPRMPTQSFVGRSGEIEQLREALERSSAVRVAASVEGLPGVGKTELALQFVYQMADEGAFPGGIFWFDAEDPDLTSAWGSVIADDLDIPSGPVEERAHQALRVVKNNPGLALIVLDNVETWTATAKPGPLPTGGRLRRLVTTRQGQLGGAQFSHVAVGFLQPPFDRQLLEKTAGRELGEGSDDLLKHLGGHALAVELAGAFLRAYPQETPSNYLEELRSGEAVEEADMVRYGLTVSQAFGTLWERLDEDVRSVWTLAACFEPEPVTDELSKSVGLTRAMRRKLQRLHLIEVDQDRRWWMHRLTREFGKGAEGAEEALVAFVEGCARFAGRIDVSDGFRHYLPNRSHLDAAVRAAPGMLGEGDHRVSEFLDRVGKGLYSIGDYSRSRRLQEQALASDLKNLGEDHPTVAIHRNNLAVVLQAQGDLDGAREHIEQALKSGLKSFGEDHPNVAILRNVLAQVLKAQGDLAGARELFEQALESDLKNLGEDHPTVAIRRSNFAGVLRDQGDLAGACELLEQALESDLKNYGEDHPEVAIDRSNLAGVLQDQGDLDGARELYEQALESDLKNLGEDHPNVAIRRWGLGTVFRDQGDLSDARKLIEVALSSYQESLGDEHPTTKNCQSQFDSLLRQIADQDKDDN